MVIKLQGSHYRDIQEIKTQDDFVFTIADDFTCKIFEARELSAEIYIPKRSILCLDILKEDVVLGLNDGKIRIFNFITHKVDNSFRIWAMYLSVSRL